MNTYEADARAASRALDRSNLTRQAFAAIYETWSNRAFDWRVHTGLLLSPCITATEFLFLSSRFHERTIMQEECLAQIRRFDLSTEERETVLWPLLPDAERRAQPKTWSLLERLAMQRL